MQFILIAWLVTAVAGGGMYLWQSGQIKDQKLEIQGLTIELGVAESNLEVSEAKSALAATQVDQFIEKMAEIDAERATARKQVQEMQALFNGHDFNNLLQKKPGLIQNRMQAATIKLFKEMEDEINPPAPE
jgi:uncharacterized protein (UPF0335 family)